MAGVLFSLLNNIGNKDSLGNAEYDAIAIYEQATQKIKKSHTDSHTGTKKGTIMVVPEVKKSNVST